MDGIMYETQSIPISSDCLETSILQKLEEQAVIDLDVLIQLLPEYSWNQIFHAVDQLARIRKIVLRRHHYNYRLLLGAQSDCDLQMP